MTIPLIPGRTISLYGDSGAGKTTQLGELAKDRWKSRKQRLRLHTADRGGFKSILPLVRLGIVVVDELGQGDNPWDWINRAVDPDDDPDIGIEAYESGTSFGEACLSATAKSPTKIGQQATQRFKTGENSSIGINNMAHYGIVQSFLLDAMWTSSWITRKGKDVIWTFSTLRSESTDAEQIVGMEMAGKALTPKMPKWFENTFRIVTITNGGKPEHVLYIQPQPGATSSAVSFGNARYPLDATTELPVQISPASIVEALRLIDLGQEEAYDALKAELGVE